MLARPPLAYQDGRDDKGCVEEALRNVGREDLVVHRQAFGNMPATNLQKEGTDSQHVSEKGLPAFAIWLCCRLTTIGDVLQKAVVDASLTLLCTPPT